MLKYGALAAFAGAWMGMAQAADAPSKPSDSVTNGDIASTAGGLKIKSADGNFEASLGGRIHFDGYLDIPGHNRSVIGGPDAHGRIGSNAVGDTGSEFQFRRVYVTLLGKLYGFEYHIDYDIAASSFQDLWIAHSLIGSDAVYLGQHKIWRSFEELASNNNILFLERNIASAVGVYGGVDYTQGGYYAFNHQAFAPSDNVWLGASGYSLHQQTTATQTNTQGTGYNVRAAYAPIVDKTMWAHVGGSFTSDNLDVGGNVAGGGSTLNAAYAYGGRRGAKITLASYGVVASPALSGNPHADSISGELAGAFGPLYLQGEYVDVKYHQHNVPSNSVDVYSLTAAFMLTGETRPYDRKSATFGGIKPANSYGAVEVALRYDHGQNNLNGGNHGCADAGVVAALVTKCVVSTETLGINYYVNPAVRFMLNYQHGRAAFGPAGQDNTDFVGARAQLVF